MLYYCNIFNCFGRILRPVNKRSIQRLCNCMLYNMVGIRPVPKNCSLSLYWKSYSSKQPSVSQDANFDDSIFFGERDRYNGLIVNSTKNPCSDVSVFSIKLQNSLEKWKNEGVRGLWFNFSVEYSFWIPILAKNDFSFHHAEGKELSMTKWLPDSQQSGIPAYSHTMTGVGAVVVNNKNEILVISERYKLLKTSHWKLPGGHIGRGETIADAAVREVLEETGIKTNFESLVAFRHSQGVAFGCCDLYFIVELSPISSDTEIKKCDREIEACQWMKIDEYVEHPEVLENNRMIAKNYIACKKAGIRIKGEKTFHQLLKRQQTIFTIDFGYKS